MPKQGKIQPENQHTFQNLLNFLDLDPEAASAAYVQLHGKLTRYFERHDCPGLFAEEFADRTLKRTEEVINQKKQDQQGSREAFVLGVAKNILREWRAQVEQRKTAVSVVERSDRDGGSEQEFEIMRICQDNLTDAERHLLESYNQRASKENAKVSRSMREEIARQHGLSIETMRVRIHRIKSKLAKCCNCCKDCLNNPGTVSKQPHPEHQCN